MKDILKNKSVQVRQRILRPVYILVFIVVISTLFLIFFARPTPSLVDGSEFTGIMELEYPTNFNYRQNVNECGPYAVGAVARVILNEDIDSQEMVDRLPWKLPRGYTHPWALEKLLKSMGIATMSYSTKKLSASEKQRFLMQELRNGLPIILLVKMYGYQHYVVLLGFNGNTNEFYIYDPVYTRGEDGYTIDDNDDKPGNTTIYWNDLYARWDEGGVFGLFDWYALVAGQ